MFIPIAIHKSEGSVYGVTVPDIPGCHSWGETIEHAVANAKEAIVSHLETLIELGEPVDIEVSDIAELATQEDFEDATWAVVDVYLSQIDPTPERVNISLPRYVLKKIEAHTKTTHQTRSGFLAKAALHEMEREKEVA